MQADGIQRQGIDRLKEIAHPAVIEGTVSDGNHVGGCRRAGEPQETTLIIVFIILAFHQPFETPAFDPPLGSLDGRGRHRLQRIGIGAGKGKKGFIILGVADGAGRLPHVKLADEVGGIQAQDHGLLIDGVLKILEVKIIQEEETVLDVFVILDPEGLLARPALHRERFILPPLQAGDAGKAEVAHLHLGLYPEEPLVIRSGGNIVGRGKGEGDVPGFDPLHDLILVPLVG